MPGVLGGNDILHNGATRGPTYIDNIVLAAGVAKTITVPIGASIANFSFTGGNFFVRWNGGAAAVPVADVLNGDGAEVNPMMRYTGIGAANPNQKTFSVVADADGILAIAWTRL